MADVLVVEDNPGDVKLIEKAFTSSQVSLHTVGTGEDALDFLRAENGYEDVPRPDLVLLDLSLPTKNGDEVLREMEDEPRLSRIPVIVFTSSGDVRDVTETYERGANAYLTNPSSFSGFVDIAEQLERFWLETAKLPP